MITFNTVDILLMKKSRRFGGTYLYVSAIAMFAAITMVRRKPGLTCQPSVLTLAWQHEVIDIVRVMQAYTENETDPNWPAEYYAELKSSISVFKTVIYTVVTIISDAFIVSLPILLSFFRDSTRRSLH